MAGRDPASLEPTIDQVVTEHPRFAFEEFPQADPTLMTQMKPVGEVMSIRRTFSESPQRHPRSLEIGRSGLDGDGRPWRIGADVYGIRELLPRDAISRKLTMPNAEPPPRWVTASPGQTVLVRRLLQPRTTHF